MSTSRHSSRYLDRVWKFVECIALLPIGPRQERLRTRISVARSLIPITMNGHCVNLHPQQVGRYVCEYVPLVYIPNLHHHHRQQHQYTHWRVKRFFWVCCNSTLKPFRLYSEMGSRFILQTLVLTLERSDWFPKGALLLSTQQLALSL